MYFIVSYPAKPGARFDRAYYVGKHIPLVREAWEPYGLEYIDAFFPSAKDSDLIVAAMCRFKDRAALEAAFASARTSEVMADIEKFTNIEPDRHVTNDL
ncbi:MULTISPECIES: EthD family reductase [Pseudomonas]|uniref:EthD family reductase n=1 Tax=Pseudomonas TaxID=286 RepID=UPI001C303C69|nr:MULTISPECIES: EthD family reductase [Pseudomonas]MBV2079627.1 EthD family reductase [Pseudomonas carnis]MBV2085381.1 EthD family reductase [Pseudomonas carnis]MDO3689355.1 EthD family reductase [Pseudomonas sp. DKN 2791]MDO7031260.1 EthD family reductase [Pseudomonas sp. DKN 2792]